MPARTTSLATAAGGPRWLLHLSALGAVGLMIGLLASLPTSSNGDRLELDGDLCPLDATHIAGRAVVLFDFQKPWGEHDGIPAHTLRHVAAEIARHVELRAFALADSPAAPRTLLARICKPYDNAELQVEGAKDGGHGIRDCTDLPAQLPRSLREQATEYCSRREALAGRLTRMAGEPAGEPVKSAPLVEAIEDARLELSGSERTSLLVLSDMMQHGAWYSHLDREPADWEYDDFARARAGQRPPISLTAPVDESLDVTIFYVRRQGVTEHPRTAETHRRFWARYFENRVGALVFEDVQPLLAYDVATLTPDQPEAEDDAIEQLRSEREEAQRLLSRVAAEQQALEEARQRAAAEERDRQAREAELAERRAALEEAEAQQAREREQLARQRQEAERRVSELEAASEAPDDEPSARPEQPPAAEAAPTLPRCPVTASSARAADYPDGRRVDYGSATIVVSYEIDDAGLTVDDEVHTVLARSSADRPQYLGLFAAAAEDAARGWEFDFGAEEDCRKAQRRMTRFRFDYRN